MRVGQSRKRKLRRKNENEISTQREKRNVRDKERNEELKRGENWETKIETKN